MVMYEHMSPSITTEETATELLNRFGLLRGAYVCFEKVSANRPSYVHVGTKVEGVLQKDIELHHGVTFCASAARLSPIQKILVNGGVLYLETSTSLYQNISFQTPIVGTSFAWSQIHHVVTERGSVYRYLPNGKTQRFKTLENYLSPMKDLLVFIPNPGHAERVLDYVHDSNTRVRVVNANGRHMKSNEDINRDGGPIYITLGRGETVDHRVPASHLPKIGYSAFDQTINSDGTTRLHLGHAVSKIALKTW
jgi:hypothetical protein